ncbi:MAG: hypothetical protein ACRELF_07710 [Gemmataceae bacterium]
MTPAVLKKVCDRTRRCAWCGLIIEATRGVWWPDYWGILTHRAGTSQACSARFEAILRDARRWRTHAEVFAELIARLRPGVADIFLAEWEKINGARR